MGRRPRAAYLPDQRPLAGFTLVELLIVMSLIGLLASMALPSLTEALEKGRVARAIGDIKALAATAKRRRP